MWAKIIAFIFVGAVGLMMLLFGTCALFFRR